jgi:hypothetical protein
MLKHPRKNRKTQGIHFCVINNPYVSLKKQSNLWKNHNLKNKGMIGQVF